ncbi:uncharacterized protein RCC_08752 [Ramularia collo-cygni]|uniref:Uncharacterized protein n=1 Tax=Ramularia collo-cygni TaxID=112498 RepID=A0A2D3VDC2_9PEZI|nr:uncharacterized protein RCC_08752 [Ramularia collo-cygni]CZT23042.1 uncharacterized protein RCC_08752 [Ramularia collo-cygni]
MSRSHEESTALAMRPSKRPAAPPADRPAKRLKASAQPNNQEEPVVLRPPEKTTAGPPEPIDYGIDCFCGESHPKWSCGECSPPTAAEPADTKESAVVKDSTNVKRSTSMKKSSSMKKSANVKKSADMRKPVEEDKKPWITPALMEKIFPQPPAPRGPGGDVYGIDSWRAAAAAAADPLYVVRPDARSNPIRRIMEQAEREKDLESVTTWNAEVTQYDWVVKTQAEADGEGWNDGDEGMDSDESVEDEVL